MNLKAKFGVLMIVALPLVVSSSCQTRVNTRNRVDEAKFPHTILWAWERPEDLEFLDSQRFAVAFLAQTLVLKGDDVVFTPRRQPLKVSTETRLIAVTRIESQKVTGERAALSPAQSAKLVALVRKTLELGHVSAIQIDFDAATSEREFYRTFLQDLRRVLQLES